MNKIISVFSIAVLLLVFLQVGIAGSMIKADNTIGDVSLINSSLIEEKAQRALDSGRFGSESSELSFVIVERPMHFYSVEQIIQSSPYTHEGELVLPGNEGELPGVSDIITDGVMPAASLGALYKMSKESIGYLPVEYANTMVYRTRSGKLLGEILANPINSKKVANVLDLVAKGKSVPVSETQFLKTLGLKIEKTKYLRNALLFEDGKTFIQINDKVTYKRLFKAFNAASNAKNMKNSAYAIGVIKDVAKDLKRAKTMKAGSIAQKKLLHVSRSRLWELSKVANGKHLQDVSFGNYRVGKDLVVDLSNPVTKTGKTFKGGAKRLSQSIDDFANVANGLKAKKSIFAKAGGALGKFFKIGGAYLGVPHAIVNNAFQVGLLASLPDISPPHINIEREKNASGDVVGAKFIIYPNFELNMKRWKSMRNNFEESIDQGKISNAAWEIAGFFDPTELAWWGASYIPALEENENEFFDSEKGCVIAVVTDGDKSEVYNFIKDMSCTVSDDNKKNYENSLFLPDGNHIVVVHTRFSEKFNDKVIGGDTSLPHLPASVRNEFHVKGNDGAALDFINTVGFPSMQLIVSVDGVGDTIKVNMVNFSDEWLVQYAEEFGIKNKNGEYITSTSEFTDKLYLNSKQLGVFDNLRSVATGMPSTKLYENGDTIILDSSNKLIISVKDRIELSADEDYEFYLYYEGAEANKNWPWKIKIKSKSVVEQN